MRVIIFFLGTIVIASRHFMEDTTTWNQRGILLAASKRFYFLTFFGTEPVLRGKILRINVCAIIFIFLPLFAHFFCRSQKIPGNPSASAQP